MVKRPENLPSLQKVDLDDEISAALSERGKDSKIRKADWHLKSVHLAIVKATIMLSRMADTAATAQTSDDIRQTMTDQAMEAIQVLSYGAQQVHPIRRYNIKPRLASNLRNRLCKSSLEGTNKSHRLFGGDLHRQVKEGEIACIENCCGK